MMRSGTSTSGWNTPSRPTYVQGMKHELMVNHLYQMQLQKLWIGDDSGEVEGALIRKQMGSYLACPSNLAHSPLAIGCTALNVQVNL